MRQLLYAIVLITVSFFAGYATALYRYAPYSCKIDGNPFTCDDVLLLEAPSESDK